MTFVCDYINDKFSSCLNFRRVKLMDANYTHQQYSVDALTIRCEISGFDRCI